MEKTIKLGCDIDGVVANFDEGFFKWFNIPYTKYPRWENPYIEERFPEIHEDSRFWMSLDPLFMPEDIDFDIEAWITHRPIHTEITEAWFREKGFTLLPVHSIYGSKGKLCKELGITDFIDDRPFNVAEVEDHGVRGWIMDAYYNQYWRHPRRINHVTEIKEKIFS